MPTLTPLAVTCLAVLVEQPMHPYQMYSLLKERQAEHTVKLRPGSLYHAVERLARDGLAEPQGTERAGNRPERTTYAITEAGRIALRRQLSEMLDTPVTEYPVFPVALSEAHNLPREQVVLHLTTRAERLEALVREAEAAVDSARGRGVAEMYWLVADYLRATRQGELNWIRTILSRLERNEISWNPERGTTNPE